MNKTISFVAGFFIISGCIISLYTPRAEAATAATVSSPFVYHFSTDGVLEESYPMSNSSSPYFWLNSGGRLILKNGIGETVQGALPIGDKWQKAYAKANPLDTDGGLFPQGLFRLVTRSKWNNVSEEVRFNIQQLDPINTPNRDGYSGILLFSRYQDEYNLYYAGIRQDGTAVIKKKRNGIYTTLAQSTIFPGTYNKTTHPNLLPSNKWMRLKEDTKTLTDGSVSITLWLDTADSGIWTKLLTTIDKNNPVTGPAYAGIRTDYMDVLFDDYKLTNI